MRRSPPLEIARAADDEIIALGLSYSLVFHARLWRGAADAPVSTLGRLQTLSSASDNVRFPLTSPETAIPLSAENAITRWR